MSNLETRFFRAAVIYALLGMAGGVFMAASGDHRMMPAHAHLILLGWVSMFIYGAFCRFYPSVAGGLMTGVWWLANLGIVLLVPGVAVIYVGEPNIGEPLASGGAVVTITSMALFAVVVFRGTRSRNA